MSTIDNLNALIEQLVSLRNDLETAEQEGCGCVPEGSTCWLCLADWRIRKAMELGFSHELNEIESEIKAGFGYYNSKIKPQAEIDLDAEYDPVNILNDVLHVVTYKLESKTDSIKCLKGELK